MLKNENPFELYTSTRRRVLVQAFLCIYLFLIYDNKDRGHLKLLLVRAVNDHRNDEGTHMAVGGKKKRKNRKQI